MSNLKTVTRFPNGVTNSAISSTFGHIGHLDPSKHIQYFEDFVMESDMYAASPTAYTITTIGAGTVAPTSISGTAGGFVLLTNAAADNDQISIQSKTGVFVPGTKKEFALKTRFKVSDATLSSFFVGVAISDTTPLDATARIGFEKAKSSTTCNGVVVKASTSTTVGSTTISNDTFVTLGLIYRPNAAILEFYLNDVLTGSTTTLTNFDTATVLTPTISIKNGEAVAKTMTIDYVFASQER